MAKASSAREDLIDSAVELFRARGYEGVGVAELLEHAGAPRGSLYFHFPGGKEQIGVEAIRRVAASVLGQFQLLNASGVDLETYVDRVFKATAKTVRDRGFDCSCPIAAAAVEMRSDRPLLASAVREAFASWEREIISGVQARGLSAKHAADFASAMLLAIEGALLVSKAQRSAAPHQNAAKAMKALAASLVQAS